jgi:hypothetical protein
MSAHPPEDWLHDYYALMNKIQDPEFRWQICVQNCAIKHAQSARKDIDRVREAWASQGGEEARQKFYERWEKIEAEKFRRQDAMQKTQLRVVSEFGRAGDRTCDVLNFFKCPYGEEYKTLLEDGQAAFTLWGHIKWYDHHWNHDPGHIPAQDEMKWYHFNEPRILDVTNYEDIRKALNDGRLDKIAAEHERYLKESEDDR